ncbi:glycoside hydrolase family 17 protein [Cucurbitaria berberidis CBS 394.84]|uniref:glucan endo-1,3-beta-D-glucosidase n=1 Tax=Cucurbitaria berberidis CBS 394.84 TaxID=1168544 RepID=A0A9P4GKV9_9PLEO|nr:glycoside hydrolase family 17 protein [Cucurbitaria berberidis CBS 394.84]KAF1847532.1 glycoside hydrolase family 17 protein [Cucurbitaria berberidis CBS 394.84]
MTKLHLLILLAPWLAQAASKIYTGFNYGSFWGVEANVKQKADFLDGFTLAKNLSAHTRFDSARLFTCRAGGTLNEPTGAFDAAVEAKTNLLLGFWITPGNRGDAPDENVKNEMTALEKGFQKHGQALADLVIGLSVGNEDIYRWKDTAESGVAEDVVSQTIDKVKKAIAASSFAAYMKDKPIGHVDTAKHAVVKNADFIGMTAYPYWNKESIGDARISFHGSLENVKQRAGNTPVWIAEMGWPFNGPQIGAGVASAENVQKFWTEVGCSVFGLYTTFWFELLKDSTADQPDWGLIDAASRQPRIKDLSCPGAFPGVSASTPANSYLPPTPAPTDQPSSTTLATSPSQSVAPMPPSSNQPSVGTLMPDVPSTANSTSKVAGTTHITTTVSITVRPAPPTPIQLSGAVEIMTEIITVTITSTHYNKRTPSPSQTPIPNDRPWCVTVVDLDRNGNLVTVAGGPAGSDGKCSTPSTYNGFPYITSGTPVEPTHVPIGSPWCVTMADVDRNGRPLPVAAGPAGADSKCRTAPTHTGWPYVGSQTTVVSNMPEKSTDAPALASLPPSPVPPVSPSSEAVVSSTTLAVSTSMQPEQSFSSSVHPYCQRKLSGSSQSSAALPPSVPPAHPLLPSHTSAIVPTTSSRAMNDANLPAFSFPRPPTTPKQRRWLWFLRAREVRGREI